MMKYLKYTLFIVPLLGLLTFLTVRLYFHYDVPIYSGTMVLPELQDTVEVYTDFYGVPHVFAQNNEDLFYTAGYIIARERLFQLSLLASVARGESSILLGDDYNKHDDYIKQNKLFSISKGSTNAINSENELLIQAYCSGINTWIDETEETLPLSFKILNKKPLKWTSIDVINVVSMMTGDLNRNRQKEWLLNTIGQYYGEKKLLEILSVETFNQINTQEYFLTDLINKVDLTLEKQIWELVGAISPSLQNDAIIIPKEQTLSQKPIIIFEDVYGMQLPTKWYDMHLNGGDFNIEGAVIPGFPIPLVGKNNSKTWAVSGQVTTRAVNNLFDYISNTTFNEPVESFSHADTSGYKNNPTEYSLEFKLLQEQLADLEKISINDIIDKLSETKNTDKFEYVQKIVNIYLDNNFANKRYLNILNNGDGDEPATPSESLLINVIYTKLLENIFMDEFSLVGEDVFGMFVSLSNLAEQSIYMILNNSDISWIDDIKTVDYKENLVEIVTKSVDEAINEIKKKYGNNIHNRQLANSKIYKHILHNKSVITKLFNLNIEVDTGFGSYNNVYETSLQRIFDLSDMNTSYSILPTGQSGLPKSVHYGDQADMFNNHDFRKVEFDKTTIRNSDKYQKLVLYPAE
jgi:acyl-homoserine lactone acylase PvdQ